jgi:Permuted papain-like amidase enzyme, YaeF/YiiX, C92 family
MFALMLEMRGSDKSKVVFARLKGTTMAKPKTLCAINLTPAEIKRGDTGYAKTNGFLGLLIRVGERLKWRKGEVNHAFIVVTEGDSYDEVWIIQATLKGVVKSRLSELIASAQVVEIYGQPEGVYAERVAVFAEKQIGKPYGILSDLCIALDILTPDWFIEFRRNWTWICSAMSGEAMRFGGWYLDVADIYCLTPQQLKDAHLKCLP